ncbi:metallophosphoesterase [Bacteroidia bacterium]|nr:metallophosphoesterase [Bacteroidia bacterium]
MLLLLFSGLLLFANFGISEHDEFINSTFFERRKHISTDGPYIIYDEKEGNRVIEIDSKFSIKEYDLLNKKQFDVHVYSFHKSVSGNFPVKLKDTIAIPPSKYDLNSDILVLSDIEGNWYAFKTLLLNAGVMDNNYNWIFGNGHLVLLGDFMDRGLNVTQILWLIYKLEDEAEQTGGKVHFILGNHEIMNLEGSIYHVRSKYKKLAKKLGVGYSTYLLGKNSELGRWLRSKNTIEKIGEYLFVHGGIGAEMDMKKMDMDTINSQVRQYIQNPVLEQKDEFLFGKAGPLWYRGYIRDRGDSISNHIENVLNFYNVNKIIVGHSTVSRIKSYCNDKVIDVDVHFPSDSKDKTTIGQCLLIKKSGEYYRVLSNGEKELLFEDKF